MQPLDIVLNLLNGDPSTLSGSGFPDSASLSAPGETALLDAQKACADLPRSLQRADFDTSESGQAVKDATRHLQKCQQSLMKLRDAPAQLERLLNATQRTKFETPNALSARESLCMGLEAQAATRVTDAFAEYKSARKDVETTSLKALQDIVMKSCSGVVVKGSDGTPIKLDARSLAKSVHASGSRSSPPTGIWVLLIVVLFLFIVVVALIITMHLRAPQRKLQGLSSQLRK